jgi:hypothetical protein
VSNARLLLPDPEGPVHHEAAPREIDGDALQVVLAGVDDTQDGIGHG